MEPELYLVGNQGAEWIKGQGTESTKMFSVYLFIF